MKYPPHIYAHALAQALGEAKNNEAREECLKHFLRMLRKNGDMALAEKILTRVEELFVKERGGRVITLEFARPMPKELLARLDNFFKPTDYIKVRVNTRLIAGIRITIDGEEELDSSLARKMSKMFANI